MLLNGREARDAFVVGEGFVVRGDETSRICLTVVFQNLKAQMPIKQSILTRVGWVAGPNNRLNKVNFLN